MTSAIGGSTSTLDLKSVQVGVFGGLFACLAYALMVSVPLPRSATAALVAFFGPALGVASFGLSRLLSLKGPLVTSFLGAMLNALAGALFSAMGLVQLETSNSPSFAEGCGGYVSGDEPDEDTTDDDPNN
jgi:hypothetical protein